MQARADLLAHAERERAAIARDPVRPCKICGAAARPFDTVDFAKTCAEPRHFGGVAGIPVVYHRCDRCAFIFTGFADAFTPADFARWIYDDAYVEVDPDFVDHRPRLNAGFVEAMFGDRKAGITGLDFGGGDGLTATLLRRQGWNYDCFDPFGAVDMADGNAGRYDLCTAFEVFEHLPDPAAALHQLLGFASPARLIIALGTHLSDGAVDDASRLAWWYAAPRNGHISLFSAAAMRHLAATAGLDYLRPRPTLHLLTRGWSRPALWALAASYVAVKAARRLAGRDRAADRA